MNSNVLEFYVKMKDLASGGLAKLAQTAQSTFTKMRGNVDGAISSTKFMSHSVDELREKLKRVNEVRFGTVMKSEFTAATRAAKGLETQISKLEGRSSRGRGTLSRAAGFIAPIALAGSLMSFGTSSVKAAMNFEATKKSFQVLTGSQSIGTDLSEQLRSLKQNTIMGPAVYANAQKMLGFGIAADKVVPNLKMLGDVSMGDAAKLGRLTLAFSEVEAAGKLNGRRFLQFINAGFNPLQEMSRTTGLSMEKLAEKMKKGEVSAKMLEDSFKSATGRGGRFNDMMNQMGETTFGKMKKLEGQWANFKINTGEFLMPLANGLMDIGSKAMKALSFHETISTNLLSEKAEINSLVSSITNLNNSNDLRARLLQTLKAKYPDYFSSIDLEKVKNSELLSKLNEINSAYDKRITLATNASVADELSGQVGSLTSDFNRYSTAAALAKQGYGYLASQKLDWLERQSVSEKDANNPAFYQAKADKIKARLDPTQNDLNRQNKLNDVTKLLADAQGSLSSGAFSGITKDAFSNLILKTMGKGIVGMASEADYTKLRSYMTASQIKGKEGKETSLTSDEVGNKAVASGITGGGPRVININFKNMVEKIDIHSSGIDAGLTDMEDKIEEHFLRILNSGASVQGN